METHDAGDVFAEVVASFTAGTAMPAGDRAIHHDGLARAEIGHAFANGGDFARGFRADRERQRALGEGHAAKTPDVDMIESHGLDADLHLAGTRRRGGGVSTMSSLRSDTRFSARMAAVSGRRLKTWGHIAKAGVASTTTLLIGRDLFRKYAAGSGRLARQDERYVLAAKAKRSWTWRR